MLFFFQAEDGIRDPLVTGVQTCALPISRSQTPAPSHGAYSSTCTRARRARCCPRCRPPGAREVSSGRSRAARLCRRRSHFDAGAWRADRPWSSVETVLHLIQEVTHLLGTRIGCEDLEGPAPAEGLTGLAEPADRV